MSLAALENVETGVANRALATTVLSLGNATVREVAEDVAPLAHALIAEARHALGIDTEDNRPESLRRIRTHLAAEVDKRLFAGVDRRALRVELGASGELPLGGYRVQADGSFKVVHKREKLKTAELIIRHPDAFHHMLNNNRSDSGDYSFFVKRINNQKRDKKYWAIVGAVRLGDVLHVTTLWRLFTETVDTTSAISPIDLLRSFVAAYGMPFSLVGRQLSGLILDQKYPSNVDDDPKLVGEGSVESLTNFDGKCLNVAIAYGIDTKRYGADWIRFA